jgi:peptidoglycan/xylan/chitin deacetylase (PgdA/CDA1 family)
MTRRPLPTVALLLLALLGADCGDGSGSGRAGDPDGPTALRPIPDKTVVLTFDDASRSHLVYVAPLLKRHGFGATFFVSASWMSDRNLFLTWPEVAALHRMGFEVGNHSWTHPGCHRRDAADFMPEEIGKVEEALARVGVPKPTSFAWPASVFGPEARQVLIDSGYRFARRGIHPEFEPGQTRVGTIYDPKRYDPLLIPSAGDAGADWTLAHLKRVVSQAKDGRIAVLVFHGVPDLLNQVLDTSEERFASYVRYLAEENYHVIALRDLGRYVDPQHHPDDPLITRRVPEDIR